MQRRTRRALYVTLGGVAAVSWALVRCSSDRAREAEGPHAGEETAASVTAATQGSPSAHAAGVSPSVVVASSSSLAASAPVDAAASGPAALMQEIRAQVKSNPQLAERLAREHQRLYPDSPDADERDAFLVASIYNQRRFDRAHLEAANYLNRHPKGRFADYVKKLVGMHDDPGP